MAARSRMPEGKSSDRAASDEGGAHHRGVRLCWARRIKCSENVCVRNRRGVCSPVDTSAVASSSSPAIRSATCSRLVSNSPRSQQATISIAPLTSANAAMSVSSLLAAAGPRSSRIIVDMASAIARALSTRARCRTPEVWVESNSCTRRGSATR